MGTAPITAGKFLRAVEMRDREHDGERMGGLHYRMPRVPIKPGDPIDESLFDVMTDMPVASIITSPRDGFTARLGDPLMLRGHAWSGHVPVASVEVSTNGGTRWRKATLGPLPDRFAWRRVLLTLPAPQPGELEIIMRATDAQGHTQPLGSAPRPQSQDLAHSFAPRRGLKQILEPAAVAAHAAHGEPHRQADDNLLRQDKEAGRSWAGRDWRSPETAAGSRRSLSRCGRCRDRRCR